MREKVHYYSKYDMSIPFNLQRAEAVIEKYKAGWRPESVNDVMELHNIWLFVDNGVPARLVGGDIATHSYRFQRRSGALLLRFNA